MMGRLRNKRFILYLVLFITGVALAGYSVAVAHYSDTFFSSNISQATVTSHYHELDDIFLSPYHDFSGVSSLDDDLIYLHNRQENIPTILLAQNTQEYQERAPPVYEPHVENEYDEPHHKALREVIEVYKRAVKPKDLEKTQ